jgi:FkbM family methyltransferase
MNQKFYRYISFFGLSFLREKNFQQLRMLEKDVYLFLKDLAIKNGADPKNIKSQIYQDIFVLYTLNWKRNGFFVEFGSTNGFDLSNSYLLEKDFGWKGILCEPASVWKEDLKKNRNSILDFRCVWKTSGKTVDLIVPSKPEFSKISILKTPKSLNVAQSEKVETVSLIDLLNTYNAPKNIDYLSIDTEGSEYEILEAFDFSKYRISIITCEHNFSKEREKIFKLLNKNGYQRVFQGLSRWDDWYIKSYN